MSQEIKNVLLMGAGGNLGPHILKGLVDTGKLNVTIMSREESKSTFPDDIKVIKSDYSESSLADAFKGQDAVVSTISGGALQDQFKIIDAAVKAGVKRFIPSEFGSDSTNKAGNEICPIFEGKLKAVEHLKQKADGNPNFSWTGVMTGPFFDWCIENALLGFDLKNHTATIWDKGDVYCSASNLSTIGKATASVLLHPAETKNRYVWIESFRISQNEVLAALEKSTGKKWEVKHVKAADQIQLGRDLLSKGSIMQGLVLLIVGSIINADVDTGSDFSKTRKLDNDLLGLPKESLQSSIDAAVKSL